MEGVGLLTAQFVKPCCSALWWRSRVPEPSLLLYRIPLVFLQRTGSSLSYTEGSQLYLDPSLSCPGVIGVEGVWGSGRKKTHLILHLHWFQYKENVQTREHRITVPEGQDQLVSTLSLPGESGVKTARPIGSTNCSVKKRK